MELFSIKIRCTFQLVSTIFFTLLVINLAVSIDVWNSAVYDNDSRYVQCEQAGMPFSEGFRLVYYMAEKTRQIRGMCP